MRTGSAPSSPKLPPIVDEARSGTQAAGGSIPVLKRSRSESDDDIPAPPSKHRASESENRPVYRPSAIQLQLQGQYKEGSPSRISVQGTSRPASIASEEAEEDVVHDAASAPSFETCPGLDFPTLRTKFPEGVDSILQGIKTDGLAHLAWGSKPASLLDEKMFALIDEIDNEKPLPESKFLLLKSTEEGEGNMGYGGLLINIPNLRKMIEEDPKMFASCPLLTEQLDEEGKISADDLIDRLYDIQLQPAVLAQEHLMGALLGYGSENARKYHQSSSFGNASAEEKKAILAESVEYTYEAEGKGNPHFVGPPVFRAWPGEETDKLLAKYKDESINIQNTHLKAAAESNDYDTEAPRAFLKALFDHVEEKDESQHSSSGAES